MDRSDRHDRNKWGREYREGRGSRVERRESRVESRGLSGERLRAWWFNPRDGTSQLIDEFAKTDTRSFAPPMPGEQIDWVLVVDDAAKDYPPPGQAGKIVPGKGTANSMRLHFAFPRGTR